MDKVFVRGIIEFSNICQKNCNYCGIRKDANAVKRYVMSKEEILAAVDAGYKVGFRTFVLQSGESNAIKVDQLCKIIEDIKTKYNDSAITLSIGEKNLAEYKSLFSAGANRYLLRFETANKKVFNLNHPDDDYDFRFECIENLKSVGFETGSGFLVGLPYAEEGDNELNLKTLLSLNLDMAGVGPFIPSENTPYSNKSAGAFDEVISIYKKLREADASINLAAVTALDNLVVDGRLKALELGANVYMPNITPLQFRENYNLYKRKAVLDSVENIRKNLDEKIASIGREIAWGEVGTSLKYIKKRSCT